MINAKVKVFVSEYSLHLETDVNNFLQTIDIRRVIKTEHSTSAGALGYRYTTIIYYIDMEDIRDIRIDDVLNIK